MTETGNQPAAKLESEADKKLRAQRELVLAYKRTLATEGGRRMLADLLKKFGFDEHEHENDEFAPGCTAIDLAWRSGVKNPIRHMLKMRDAALRPLGESPARRRAKSGLAPEQ